MSRLTAPPDVRRRLEGDRPWAAFSLADLDPPQAVHAHWFGPAQGTGVVLVYGAYQTPIVVCHGDIDECDRTLAEAEVQSLTPSVYLNATPAQTPAVMRHFHRFDARLMVRMLLDADADVERVPEQVIRLTPADLPALQALYVDEAPAFFLPTQLRDGIYYGVREGAELVAVAGTHVMSTQSRVAALGNVHTRADRRGRGLATAVTRAVCATVRRLGVDTCVLNIVATNDGARRVYERVGFREYCRYAEGVAVR